MPRRGDEEEGQHHQTREDVAGGVVERIVQQVAVGDHDQYRSEGDVGEASAETQADHGPGDEFDHRGRGSGHPQEPLGYP